MYYDNQLVYKMDTVKEYLEGAGFDFSFVQPIIGMDDPNRYRNKMELTFGTNGELGMHQQENGFKQIGYMFYMAATISMMN